MVGAERHIASPLQSEAQLNGPNLDRTNSSVLDESPVFSDQNIGDTGNSLGFIHCSLYANNIFGWGKHNLVFALPTVFLLLYFVTFVPNAFCYERKGYCTFVILTNR